MIISSVTDVALGEAIRSLAQPDEDVLAVRPGASKHIRKGFPRLVVYESDRPVFELPRLGQSPDGEGATTVVTAGTLARWRFEHRMEGGEGDLAARIRERLHGIVTVAPRPTWIDRLLMALERASGSRLPRAFRGLARRFCDYPAFYASLGVVAERTGLTPGALQGRFLRRALRSPSEHLRWLRLLAVAEGLGDESLTLGTAADRFGYTSAGNLSRTVQNTTSKMPSDLRSPLTRLELQTRFARDYLSPEAREGWSEMTDLFWDLPAPHVLADRTGS